MGLIAPLKLIDCSSKVDRNHERSGTRSYTGYYTLDCDEVYVRTHVQVLAGYPYVKITDAHPSEGSMFVTDISAKFASKEAMTFYDEGAYAIYNGTACYYWQIDLDFGPFNPLEQSLTGSMIDMPMRYFWEGEDYPQPLFVDFDEDEDGNGKPVLTSAGNYFNPGIEAEGVRKKLTVLRNEANPNYFQLSQMENCTNAAPWNGYPAGTVKLKPFRSPTTRFAQATSSYYQEMEYKFDIKLDGWDKKILDQDFKRLEEDDDGNMVQKPIYDEEMVPVTDPVPLDGNGSPVQQPITPDKLVLLSFQVCRKVDFSVLNMDTVLETGVGG